MKKLPSIRLLSKEGIASIGYFISMSGITLTSVVWGAQSVYYYAALSVGFVLALPLFFQALAYRRSVILALLLLAFTPLLLYSMQQVFLNVSGFEAPSLLFTLAISVTIAFAMLIALLPCEYFRWTMRQTALAHLLICSYGLANSHMILLQAEQQRLSALGVHTAVWAELAVGMVAAAVMSARPLLVFLTVLIGGLIIFKAQMRGAGLSLFILVVMYFLLSARGTPYFRSVVIMSVIGSLVVLAVSFDAIMEFVRSALLLDDPHRGIDSGFSGRFDNWEAGLNRYIASPFVGVGVSDEVAAGTHNGYLKILAQFGTIFFAIFIVFLMMSVRLAWGNKKFEIFSVIGCYAFFLVSAPRYINLQIMPFLGVVAIAFSNIGISKNNKNSTTTS